tara:strand:- start:7589 stop:7738 length:150 start_codon:yes stop_codon:yes gene_type:complete
MAGTAQWIESESSGEVNLPIKQEMMTYSIGAIGFYDEPHWFVPVLSASC